MGTRQPHPKLRKSVNTWKASYTSSTERASKSGSQRKPIINQKEKQIKGGKKREILLDNNFLFVIFTYGYLNYVPRD